MLKKTAADGDMLIQLSLRFCIDYVHEYACLFLMA